MNPSNFKDDWYVYWEKQGSDRLCGQHCLNSLVQGAFYDEVCNTIQLALIQYLGNTCRNRAGTR